MSGYATVLSTKYRAAPASLLRKPKTYVVRCKKNLSNTISPFLHDCQEQ